MAAKTIETKAVISAEDRTGAAFKAVVDHMQKMEAAAEHASSRVKTAAVAEGRTRQIAHENRMREGLARRVEATARREEAVARREEVRHIREQAAAHREEARHLREVSRLHQDISGRQQALGLAGAAIAHATAHFAKHSLETYREFDKERRYAKAVMAISDDAQKPLVEQAIHGGATSKFNDIQWLEAQRELAARGLSVQQVLGLTPVAAHLGQAMDKTLPEASKALEGGMFGFGKDISTFEKARANAKRTADLQVKASKISGMNYEDLVSTYKYGAAPFRMAGLTEEQLLAFAAVGKKANMGGDEMGVAGRALAANLLKPTAGARTAMLASGVDYSKFQKLGPRAMDVEPFAQSIAASYGVALSEKAKDSLKKVFDDRAVVQDAGKFMPAVLKVLARELGGDDAKAKKSIAGEARRYRDASMSGIDSQALFNALIPAIRANPALANLLFGAKQGARIRTALGSDAYEHKLDELKNHSEGYAEKISAERMAGFDGAVSRFEGAIKNLESALPRAFDADGKGGLLTGVTNKMGEFVQALAEAPPHIQRLGATAGVAAAAFAGFKGAEALLGGFGLKGAATELLHAAHMLEGAAAKQGAPGAAGKGGGPGGVVAAPGGEAKPGAPGSPKISGLGWRSLFTGWSLGNLAMGANLTPKLNPDGTPAMHRLPDGRSIPEYTGPGYSEEELDKMVRAGWGKLKSALISPAHGAESRRFGGAFGLRANRGRATPANPFGSLPSTGSGPGGFQPIGAAGAVPTLAAGSLAPKPQKVDVSIAPPAPLVVKFEVTSSSELIRIVDALKQAQVQLKAMAATAPGGHGETSTHQ